MLLQIRARNPCAASQKGTYRIGLNQRVNAGWWGEAAEVSLVRPHPGSMVHINRVVKSDQKMFPQKWHSYIHIYTNTHAHIKTHCKAKKTPRMRTGWSSLAFGQKKTPLPRLVSGHWKTSALFCNFLKYFQHVLAQLSSAPRELWKCGRLMELPGRAVARLCPGQQTEERFQHTLKIQILSKSLESRCQLWITWLLCHIFPGYAHWLR